MKAIQLTSRQSLERVSVNQFQFPKKSPPLPRCYWVLEDSLLAGAYPGKEDPAEHQERIAGLYQAGMRTFISLMEPKEKNNSGVDFLPYTEILQRIAVQAGEAAHCKNFPIKDRSITTLENMRSILDAIDESLENQSPVYVHCFGGIGRTGTVIACWLLRHRHASVTDVLDLLKRLRLADKERSWRDAPENDEQIAFVYRWAQEAIPRICKPVANSQANRSDWFTELFGFSESTPEQVRSQLRVQADRLISDANEKSYVSGRLGTPTLSDLREQVDRLEVEAGGLKISEVVADVQTLHTDVSNAGAVFQVASQFNLLEMVSPSRTPEEGVGIYQYDRTQGPACAIACGAGTIFRNYFVDLGTQIGQSQSRQVDCLADFGQAIGNAKSQLWEMRNGYALPNAQGLAEVNRRIKALSDQDREVLQGHLRVGIQWGTQVTLRESKHCVTQVYCSALPIAYCSHATELWEPFARLVLEGAYEATFLAAMINALRTGNRSLYLTNLGGGAFGNPSSWIYDAIGNSLKRFQNRKLDVKMVSYGSSNPQTKRFIASVSKQL